MKDEKLITGKTLWHVGGGIAAVYALTTIVLGIMMLAQYDTQNLYTKNDLKNAQVKVTNAINQYNKIDEQLQRDCNAALYKDTKYLNMHYDAGVLTKKLQQTETHTPQYINMLEQLHKIQDDIALREDSLQRAYINNHPDMRRADGQLKHAEKHLIRVQQDCDKLDSLSRAPKIQRFKNNWNAFRADWRMIQDIKKR